MFGPSVLELQTKATIANTTIAKTGNISTSTASQGGTAPAPNGTRVVPTSPLLTQEGSSVSSAGTEPAKSSMVPVTSDPNARPIVTMFTTFKNSPQKEHIYKNTIRNWQRLGAWVKPIMYYLPGETDLTEYAREHGWETLQVPKLSAAKVPILRHMFLDAKKRHSTSFYCYANGDILFEPGLIETLKTLEPVTAKMKQVLIVGRRTNFKLTPKQNIDKFEDIQEFNKQGKLFGTNAQDYFISTPSGYPWDTIPDFVVGRVGYDNWLVVTAIVKKMNVIDTTGTVIALHQTGTDGNFAGKQDSPYTHSQFWGTIFATFL